MDDRPNIVNNQAFHIADLMPQTLWQTFFANQGKTSELYRPLPCLSFALNWYFGKDDTFGYHLVNFSFHLATAIALYFLLIQLLCLIYQQKPSDKELPVQSIALLGVAFWVINPIHTQAVTYIVQRMAVMAAFFYVLGMLYFVKARTAKNTKEFWLYAALCFFWFLCALGSKENAIMLPFSLILVEWIFFQKGGLDFLRRPAAWAAAVCVCALMFILVVVLTDPGFLKSILSGYNNRPFTFAERVLTQPRVVLMYVSQIFYPLPSRLSIAHDLPLSVSLLDPWTTLPAIGLIFALVAGAFAFASRFPLISFAMLFFFLNHVVESSVLPLEMIFEHRNYLPSLFLFMPLAAGLWLLLVKLKNNTRFLYVAMSVTVIITLIALGVATYKRNAVWATSVSLWTDAALKAPNSIRPLVMLGIRLGWKDNPSPVDYRRALALFQRSLELPEAARNSEHAEILGNIASIYFHQQKYEKAISAYHQAIEEDSGFHKNRFDLIKPLILSDRFVEAEKQGRYLVKSHPDNPKYHAILGFVLLWQEKVENALFHFQQALKNGLNSPRLFVNIGVSQTLLGGYKNGEWFLLGAAQKAPRDIVPLLGLIENRARAGDDKGAEAYARQMVQKFPGPFIIHRVHQLKSDRRSVPLKADLIMPFLRKVLQENLVDAQDTEIKDDAQ